MAEHAPLLKWLKVRFAPSDRHLRHGRGAFPRLVGALRIGFPAVEKKPLPTALLTVGEFRAQVSRRRSLMATMLVTSKSGCQQFVVYIFQHYNGQ